MAEFAVALLATILGIIFLGAIVAIVRNAPSIEDPPLTPGSPLPQVRAAIKAGTAHIRGPRSLFVWEPEIYELRISSEERLTIERQLEIHKTFNSRTGANIPESVEVEEHSLARVGCRMSAKLYSYSTEFEILPLSTETQDAALTEVLAWDWRVKANALGRGCLRVTLRMEQDANGDELIIDSPGLLFPVRVIPRSVFRYNLALIGRHWKWIIGTLISLGALLAAFENFG